LTGFYWSLTSMFSNASSMAPTNSAESVFTGLNIIIGAIFLSSVTSSMAAMLIQSQVERQAQTEKLRVLRNFLDQNNISPLLSMSIRSEVMQRMSVQKTNIRSRRRGIISGVGELAERFTALSVCK